MTNLSEEQLESLIYDNRDKIHEKGLPKFYLNTVRQFTLPSKTIIDLLTWEIKEQTLFIRIIELKKDWLSTDSIKQILGYFGTIQFLTCTKFETVNIELVLIGEILPLHCKCIVELIPCLTAYKYNFGYDGLTFGEFDKPTGRRHGDQVDKLYSILTKPKDLGFGLCEDFDSTTPVNYFSPEKTEVNPI